MHGFIGPVMGLVIAGLAVEPTWAGSDACERLTEEQDKEREMALRAVERYAACLAEESVEDSCTNQFRDLRSAHDSFGSVTWRRLLACEGD